MHPYGIQRLKQWDKDQVVNVGQRASLYRVIDKLEEMGFITAGAPMATSATRSKPPTHLTDAGPCRLAAMAR